MGKYLEVEYPTINEHYVALLASYLRQHYFKGKGFLLDIGAGTGHYVRAFRGLGLITHGVDRERNFESDALPFSAQTFNYVFSKSTLEHIANTQHILAETKRVLVDGGIALFLVPDWNSQWRCFYDDSTHIKPFTRRGLEQAFQLAGFSEVKCSYFYQLPFLWKRPYLGWIPRLVALLPDRFKYWKGKQVKLVRFSKEKMLLLSAVKWKA